MDKLVERLVSLGVPGLVLVITVSASGLAGGAAMVTALSMLGGPLGMIGGFLTLGLLVLISQAIAKYGFEALFQRVLDALIAKGMTEEEIRTKLAAYPISKDLKSRMNEHLDQRFRVRTI